MSEKDILIRKMEARIDEANAEIERLKTQAESGGKDAEAALERKLDDLRGKRQEAVELLEEVRLAGEDGLAEVRLKMSDVWNEFDAMLRAACGAAAAAFAPPQTRIFIPWNVTGTNNLQSRILFFKTRYEGIERTCEFHG
ncbi:MAG: hypothetical protein RIM80_24365 [Alphaproteobacteria bacterium]